MLDWVNNRFLERINGILGDQSGAVAQRVSLEIAEVSDTAPSNNTDAVDLPALQTPKPSSPRIAQNIVKPRRTSDVSHNPNLNSALTFEKFVEGKSNQLARAAAFQVAGNTGETYNPLFIQGGVGLGKTHLMHAIGNQIIARDPTARVVYLHSERFVQDMVKALQHNAINDFKRYYRSVNALLIDDIQFFAGKERSQEEFFHTFNALLEGQQQIILTCDRYPKEVTGLEERLKSRFGWGLTVAIEPPELETRVAILMSKAQQLEIELPQEVSNSVYNRMRTGRELVARDLRSQGLEKSERIRADADRQSSVILAEVYRDAEILRGTGDAKATEIYANAFGKNRDFYKFYRSLNAYKNNFSSSEDVILLEPDSEYFRYFNKSSGK